MSCRGYKGQKAEQPLAPAALMFSSQQRKTTRTTAAGHLEKEDLQLQPPAEEELGQVGGDKGRPISGFTNAIMFNWHNFIHHFVELNMMYIYWAYV